MSEAAPDLPARLRAAGLRVTSQRLLLHATLVEIGRHATADEVMRAAVPRLPGLSLPTVYATLELLARLGLVQRVAAGGAVRWDPGPDPHAHFCCTVCGALEDVPGAAQAGALERAAARAGLTVESVDVVLHGSCAACRERTSSPGRTAADSAG
jgi:Fe2+ or Zn2+ uptake regulation protein